MPTIKRKELHEKQVSYRHESQEMTSNFYNSMAWKRLRNTYLSTHPLCIECLKREIITPTQDIHHIHKWNSGINEEEKWNLFLSESNLISVCRKCHQGYHNKMKKYGIDVCDDLTDKEYKEAHNMNLD